MGAPTSPPSLDVDALLFDIDGVLVVSWSALPGAAGAIAECRRAGVPMRFLTNTTSASRAEIARRLGRVGIEVVVGDILTAPAATATWLRAERPAARCYVINSGDLGDDLTGINIVAADEPADIVVLGGAGEEFSYTQMNHALGLLLDGAELVGMHQNLYWRTASGFNLDTGAYLTALEQAAGVTATVLGKPSADFFTTALSEIDCAPDRAAMIGDDIDNDVLAAQAIGLTGVLVRTGKFRPDVLDAAADSPSYVIDSIADLTGLLGLV